jgi:hypothetical protein
MRLLAFSLVVLLSCSVASAQQPSLFGLRQVERAPRTSLFGLDVSRSQTVSQGTWMDRSAGFGLFPRLTVRPQFSETTVVSQQVESVVVEQSEMVCENGVCRPRNTVLRQIFRRRR